MQSRGSQIETLVEAGRGEVERRDQTSGVSGSPSTLAQADLLDPKGPDNGTKGNFRAAEIPRADRANRSDIEVLFDHFRTDDLSSISEPGALLDGRGDPPGNTVNRASIDAKPSGSEIVITHLMEGIVFAHVPSESMFVTDFAGLLFPPSSTDPRKQCSVRAGQSHGIAYTEI